MSSIPVKTKVSVPVTHLYSVFRGSSVHVRVLTLDLQDIIDPAIFVIEKILEKDKAKGRDFANCATTTTNKQVNIRKAKHKVMN